MIDPLPLKNPSQSKIEPLAFHIAANIEKNFQNILTFPSDDPRQNPETLFRK